MSLLKSQSRALAPLVSATCSVPSFKAGFQPALLIFSRVHVQTPVSLGVVS